MGVDLNENNIIIATNQNFITFLTRERVIRTAYLKRRKIQSKIKCRRVKAEVLAKYCERERNRVLDIYHKVANKIVKVALRTNSAIALENLKESRYQSIYKARINGIEVVYDNPHKTSRLCPI